MNDAQPTRDELASRYLDQLPYEPYPVQEEALLSWFTAEQGVLVCAPTGTGKTLIAEAALFEALHNRSIAYYTTPLIALTEQKFQEMQEAAVRWGFSADDVGLVTGNRRVNPEARVLVVVAEILLNRLLHTEAFDFSEVTSVVMDEFHSFADPERGIVWELSLALLPKHVRLLLLSATVGNSAEFVSWLRRSHQRRVELVQSTDRKVPLHFEWVPDQLLNEQLELMSQGDADTRKTPALVFCFNREECWSVAEQLKGKALLSSGQQKRLAEELQEHDWSQGAGPKLKQILMRGVGVHHAGLLPKYRRIVESLFQRKLLSVAVCTETLSAGMNLPARSVVVTTLLKGPFGKKKVIDASIAHQIFGRAGRPQFDDQGHIYVLAPEDDVKILRWKEKYDTIPEDTKDPNLRRAKKALKKKMPTRRKTEQYWNEAQFEKLKAAPPSKLYSKGQFPWRLLAYLLKISPDVDKVRAVVRKRLADADRLEAAERRLNQMLLTLWAGGFVTLDPAPPEPEPADSADLADSAERTSSSPAVEAQTTEPSATGATFGGLLEGLNRNSQGQLHGATKTSLKAAAEESVARRKPTDDEIEDEYVPHRATPTPKLDQLLVFRSVNPVYGAFLTDLLGRADRAERLQAFESVLDIPRPLLKLLRVPPPDQLPPGPLATEFLDAEVIQRGLATPEELYPQEDEDRPDWWEPRFLSLADKLNRLFAADFSGVDDVRVQPVWAAGELLRYGGDFNKFVTSNNLVKQEGIVFRHLLRLILLIGEFAQLEPPGTDAAEWRDDLRDIADQLTETCRKIDPESTDQIIESAHVADVVEGEFHEPTGQPQ
jgi:superfamily II DNA/RNA helicase